VGFESLSLLPIGGAAGLLALLVRIWWHDRGRWEREQAQSDERHQAELAAIDKRREAERADYERRIEFLQSLLDSEGRGGA
jgi:cytochrome c biogenesis protein ResB